MLRLSIQVHKWVGLVVGLQVFFWVFGGLVMTALPIERVRGDHRVAFPERAPLALAGILSVAEVARRADLEVSGAVLKSTPRGPVWSLTTPSGGEGWFDAITGENVEEISAAQARAAAIASYRGPGKVAKVTYAEVAPVEAQVGGPLWRVEFDDPERTRLYMSTFSGEVFSRRSDLWSFYDFFYRLHFMNLAPGGGYNHPLIVATTALTLAIVVTGFILLGIRLGRDWRAARARRLGPHRGR
jgi:uncharacterized iron-regulated membrane protein